MNELGKNKWKFNATMVQDAPDTRGVFALWENDTVVCIGRADGGEHTIRSCLTQHLLGAQGQQSRNATHYSWEICADPAAREAQLLGSAEARAEKKSADDFGSVLEFDAQRRSA